MTETDDLTRRHSEDEGKPVFPYESDEACIEAGRSGDPRAFEALYEKYKSIVKRCAGSLFLMGGEQQDLIQEGMIGLFLAAQGYNREKQTSFRTFAELCISRQMCSAIRKAARDKEIPLNTAVSLNAEQGNGGEDEETISGIQGNTGSPEDLIIQAEDAEHFLNTAEAVLSPLERKVFGLMLEGLGYIEIARILHRSPKSVDNAMQRIKMKMGACKLKNQHDII